MKSMDKIQKIDLSSSSPDTTVPVSRRSEVRSPMKFKKPTKGIFIFLGVLVLLFVISIFAIFIPAQKTYSSAMMTYKDGKAAWAALKKQNIELASQGLIKTKKDLEVTQKDLNQLSYLKYVPILSWYYNDADHLVKAGFQGIQASLVLVDSLKPYADVLGLKGTGSFVMGSAEQRIQTAVMTMGKITPRIDDVVGSLVTAKKEIDAVNPNHYPTILGGGKIQTQLATLRTVTDQGVTFVEQARPLIKVLPSLLGESKEKKFLVLFQNDKELRPTGGFITAYSIFRIDRGIIHIDRSGDIYDLDNAMRITTKAPDPILKYLPKVTKFNIRDSNISPDFVESMKIFNSLYKNVSGKTDVDGIIALDTSILVSTIKILDNEVWAGGIEFKADIDKRCNCPQVIYKLEDTISRPVNYVKEGRKDLLGLLLYSLMEKSLKSSPKLYWGPLIQGLVTETNQKHVLFYLYDQDAQSGLEALNAAGRIKNFEGDYLHINDANMGGAKANLYVKESVVQDIGIESDGTITKTITVSYKNPFPPSDCNLERGGLCLNATLRDWVRFYVPKGSQLISSQGSEVKVTTYEELGKTVFEGFFTVRPLGSAVYTIKYRLPFKLASGSKLPLLMQKQPGTYDNEYTIKVNGRETNKFPLLTDTEITISH